MMKIETYSGSCGEEIKMLLFNTLTYGLASAPYLAIRALRQLSIDENHRFPLTTDVIKRETT